jgi:hypothetical protein
MPEFITVVHGPEFARIRAQLREEDKFMDKRLERVQRRVVDALVREARAKVLALQLSGGPSRHTGLRRRVARGLRAMHRGGASTVSTHMGQQDEKNLPFAMDRAQGWRHPFFGDRSQWYQQRPLKPGWFTNTFADADERLIRNMFDELQESVDRIADAG